MTEPDAAAADTSVGTAGIIASPGNFRRRTSTWL